MYINFWYPMALSEELLDSPVKVKALGQDFVLFRNTDGEAHCLADVCVHRGGSLSGGKQLENCIQCPYHGWRYAGDGQCIHIPTLAKDAKIPTRARVDSYPVCEKYGVVFAFLGDLPAEERPEILEIKEWEQEGWSTTRLVYPWQTNLERAIENGLDATHTEFVHPSAGLQGSFDPDKLLDSQLIKKDWSSEYLISTEAVEISHGHHGANHQWTFLGFKMGEMDGWFRFYSFVRPVDESSVVRYIFHARNFQLGEKIDQQMIETNLGFEAEDRPVIEAMQPAESPLQAGEELLLPEDEIMLTYRKHLERWHRQGWHIDSEQISQAGRRRAFAIPSPARREQANWVREPVPVTGGKN